MRCMNRYMNLFFLFLFLLSAAVLQAQQVISQDDIDSLTQNIIAHFRRDQTRNGTFSYNNSSYPVGATALVLYAMRTAGVPENDPVIQRGVDFLNKTQSTNTYEEGLVLCALEKINPKRNQKRMREALANLIEWQGADGGWGYGGPKQTRSDESCSQYAILGITAAANAGLFVPPKVISNAKNFYRSQQNADGSWGYLRTGGTVSMTCAGIASLTLLGETFETPIPGKCGYYRGNEEIRKGFLWLSPKVRNFLSTVHTQNYGYYALYGLERVAILNGVKGFDGLDWYRQGCMSVIEKTKWFREYTDTAFTLLFIARNSAPIAISKWCWEGDWNPDKHDVRNWAEHASKILERPLDWQMARLDSDAALQQAGRSSMIFVSGHGEFKASKTELENLRKYLDAGGIVVAEACCNDKAFTRSFFYIMENHFEPQRHHNFTKIPEEHSLMTCHYKLKVPEVTVYNLSKGCSRRQVFFLENDISCALNGDNLHPEEIKLAQETAVNALVYALNRRKAHGKLEKIEFADIDPEDALMLQAHQGEGAVYQFDNPVGRIRFDGEWDSDPNFIRNFAAIFKDVPDIPFFDAQVPVDPESDDIFACQLLILNGHGAVTLTPAAIANLRQYIRVGGRIVVEACCADFSFDVSFRKLCSQIFPNSPLVTIPENDRIYHAPYPLFGKQLEVTHSWEKIYAAKAIQPVCGIRGIDGQWNLIYLPYDVTCALDDDLEEDITGLKADAAAKFFANIVVSLLSLNTEDRAE